MTVSEDFKLNVLDLAKEMKAPKELITNIESKYRFLLALDEYLDYYENVKYLLALSEYCFYREQGGEINDGHNFEYEYCRKLVNYWKGEYDAKRNKSDSRSQKVNR